MTAIPLDTWLVDVSPGHEDVPTLQMFKVLKIGDETVRVEYKEGHKGVANRLLLEEQLERGEVMDAKAYIKREGKR